MLQNVGCTALLLLFTLLFTVIKAGPIGNDACQAAYAITSTGYVSGTVDSDFMQEEVATCMGENIEPFNVWYSFNSGSYTKIIISFAFEGEGVETTTHYYIFSDVEDCNTASPLDTCINQGTGGDPQNYSDIVQFVSANTNYLLAVAPIENADFEFYFAFSNGDECTAAERLSYNGPTFLNGILYFDAILDAVDGRCEETGQNNYNANTWYWFDSEGFNNAEITTCFVDVYAYLNTYLFLYKAVGSPYCEHLECVATNNNDCDDQPSQSTILAVVETNTIYYVSLTSQDYSDYGPFRISLTLSVGPYQFNDDCHDAEEITKSITTGNNKDALLGGSACLSLLGQHNIWYKFSTHSSDKALFSFCPEFGGSAPAGTFVSVVSDCSAALCSVQAVDCNTIKYNQFSSLSPDTEYLVSIGSTVDSTFTFYFELPINAFSCSSPQYAVEAFETYSTNTLVFPPTPPLCFFSSPLKLLYFTFTSGPEAGNFVLISTCEDWGGKVNGDPVDIVLYTGNDCLELGCDAPQNKITCCTNGVQLTASVDPSSDYSFSLVSDPSHGSTFTFYFALGLFSATPANDFCENAVEVQSGNTYLGSTSLSSPGSAYGRCIYPEHEADWDDNVWYFFNSGSDAYVLIEILSSPFPPVITVYTGDCDNLQCHASQIGSYSDFLFPVASNTDYLFYYGFSDDGGSTGNFQFQFSTCPADDPDGDGIICNDDCEFCSTEDFSSFPNCDEPSESVNLDGFDILFDTSSQYISVNQQAGCSANLGEQCDEFYLPFFCESFTSTDPCVVTFFFGGEEIQRFFLKVVTKAISLTASENMEFRFLDDQDEEIGSMTLDRSDKPCHSASTFKLKSQYKPVVSIEVSAIGSWGIELITYSFDDCPRCVIGGVSCSHGERCADTCEVVYGCEVPSFNTWILPLSSGSHSGSVQIAKDANNHHFIWNAASNFNAKRFYVYVGTTSPPSNHLRYPFVITFGERYSSVQINVPVSLIPGACCACDLLYVYYAFYAEATSFGISYPSQLTVQYQDYYRGRLCCCGDYSYLDSVLGNVEAEYDVH